MRLTNSTINIFLFFIWALIAINCETTSSRIFSGAVAALLLFDFKIPKRRKGLSKKSFEWLVSNGAMSCPCCGFPSDFVKKTKRFERLLFICSGCKNAWSVDKGGNNLRRY